MQRKPRLSKILAGSAAIVVLIAIALAIPLVGPALRAAEERRAARPNPILTSDAEFGALAQVLFHDWEFDGIPPPPPEDDEPLRPSEMKTTILLDTSLAFCDPARQQGSAASECGWPALAELILSMDYDSKIPRRLRQELILANRASVPVPAFDVRDTIEMPRAKVDGSFAGGNSWDGFYSKFPNANGYAAISRPVLSQDGTHALLYVSHHCGGLCGTGYLHYFARSGGTWRIVDSVLVWVS